MADTDAGPLFQLIVALVWAALSTQVFKNPTFNTIFSTEKAVWAILAEASVSFCPGLLEVLNAASPPTIAFFKGLPHKFVQHGMVWGVYAIVLEKDGLLPLVYIGCSYNTQSGMWTRWTAYNRLDRSLLPKYVLEAIDDDGYQITHKGVLASFPMPRPGLMPMCRLLVLALEAMFTFAFWAVYSRSDAYGMGDCCPWSQDQFTYGGLCSHSSLNEGARHVAELELSAEELDTILWKRYVRMRETTAAWSARNTDIMREHHREHRKRARESEEFVCTLCDTPVRDQIALDRHNLSKNHLDRVEKQKRGVINTHHCLPCRYHTDNVYSFRNHQKSIGHKLKAPSKPKTSVLNYFTKLVPTATAGAAGPQIDNLNNEPAQPNLARAKKNPAPLDDPWADNKIPNLVGPDRPEDWYDPLYCRPCAHLGDSEEGFERHLGSKRHEDRLALTASSLTFKHKCKLCAFRCDATDAFAQHRRRCHNGDGQ